MPKAITDVVFDIPPGKVSAAVKTEYGYHIFMVAEKQKKGTVGLKDARDQIIEKVRQQKGEKMFRERVKELGNKTAVKINKAYMEEIK
jgi:parvulin-like peptidyl-prolyl isomerase